MRPDMHKVIVERPRHGGLRVKPRWRPRRDADGDWDGGPTKERINQRRYGTRKELADNLEPLRKWLWKQHGRRWDDVFSEMSRALPKGVHREHVMSHISAWVGGVTFTNQRSFALLTTWNRYDMVVNHAGILRRCPHARMRYWRLLHRRT